MKICKSCMHSVDEDAKFCPHCGAELEEEKEVLEPTTVGNEEDEKPNAKCWHVFAKVGNILGIVGLATCWFCLGGFVGVYGIIFSILGKRARPKEELADSGLRKSIIATCIGLTLYFILFIVAFAMGSTSLIEFLKEMAEM